MNYIYILTYSSEDQYSHIMAYQSKSQAEHDIEMLENLYARLESLRPVDIESKSEEELEELNKKLDCFENSLNAEEKELFLMLQAFPLTVGEFEIEELEIKYQN